MKTLTSAFLFLLFAIGTLALAGCASTDGGGDVDQNYPAPDLLDTQSKLQDMHKAARYQDF
ncbi:MAG: hypothetical protein KDM91_20865 [Verrucomicrobiae bacterium]|nr:hypothetical protein [Verrucomicrobiae bacterium]MCP5540749.1 hypothetical protein [Akkermansiaceae bacterium]MCP5551331.1 hypothetical protein [Akkermansiaceae bacterium]